MSWVEKREELLAAVARAEAEYKDAEKEYEEAEYRYNKANDICEQAWRALRKHDSEAAGTAALEAQNEAE